MGFHGRAAAYKPKINMGNVKRRLEWCKTHSHWTLEQWIRILWSNESSSPSSNPTHYSGFGGCQENATCPNA